jgi:pimeloyl-ACP methyl ester carboxylesterase
MCHLAGILLAMLHATLAVVSAHAEIRLGVVLMHGKQSAPDEHISLAEAITVAGHVVERPEMCWSSRRIYDRPYLQCLGEIDTALIQLQQRGATAFVVAGHSLGANAALAYGARHKLAGVIALAPGHRPEVLAQRPAIAAALDRARKLVSEGHANSRATFPDTNGDLTISVMATPETYLGFFSPDSPAVMPTNAAQLQAPLLYVVGNGDPLQRGPDEIFAKAPPHPLNRYVTIRAGHFDTSAASAGTVVSWLRTLGQTVTRPAGSAPPPRR